MLQKIYHIILFCALAQGSICQNNNYSLVITTDEVQPPGALYTWNEVLIQSKDTSFYYTLHNRTPDKIEGLKKGKYTVRLLSLFHHQLIKEVTLSDKKEITLAFSGAAKFYKTSKNSVKLSDKLSGNDTLFVAYTSLNLGETFEKLGFVKTGAGVYKVIQYKGISRNIQQELEINEQQIQALKKFEADLKKLKPKKDCPHNGTYTITFQKQWLVIRDASCSSWQGLNDLKASVLFVNGK